ncbi:MAG: C-terminal binding protein [Planctomycetota bacterium]|jgi:D-3-phosphoglycerate dehydrogenase
MPEDRPDAKRWVVGITDFFTAPAENEAEAFPEAEFRFLSDWRASDASRAEWASADALLVWHWDVDRETIAVLDKCKIAVRYGVGYDQVDVAALAERGIAFCNTPDYGTQEVADQASSMILAARRRILEYDKACRSYESGWQEHVLSPLARTSESTLGIIGVGRIGTAVVNRMKPFGFRIVGYDPYKPAGHEKAVGFERVDVIEELLEVADIVTVHCPLTDETRGMIDAGFLSKMKPGASLVNTARGKILADLDCVEAALRDGRLASAAFDVLPDEPPKDHPLLSAWRAEEEWLHGRLIVTPHCAWFSDQARREMRYKAALTARMYLLTGKLRSPVEA